jgi:EAL domain-containing protein (putative c-di-GMP-specific phosphodiesterase class I)
MGLLTVAEGVETRAERDTLIELGCDLLQGFYFARPGPAFPEVDLASIRDGVSADPA